MVQITDDLLCHNYHTKVR